MFTAHSLAQLVALAASVDSFCITGSELKLAGVDNPGHDSNHSDQWAKTFLYRFALKYSEFKQVLDLTPTLKTTSQSPLMR